MKATAVAGSNIALIKYWGNRDDALRLPHNNSISLTLDKASTTTTVQFTDALNTDEITINSRMVVGPARDRVTRHLDHLRQRFGCKLAARVASENNFPMASGIASSASAFAALTVAAAGALGHSPAPADLSALARLGSGSASRSILGGYVEWLAADKHEGSYAVQIAGPDHWQIIDVIAVLSSGEKRVKSTEGHQTAHTSPLYPGRLAHVETQIPRLREAILRRDFTTLGQIAELDALSMHAVMMTSQPSLFYWAPATLTLIEATRTWREESVEVYFTIDAGPNVHLLTLPEHLEALKARLQPVTEVERLIVCGPGQGARLIPEHLF